MPASRYFHPATNAGWLGCVLDGFKALQQILALWEGARRIDMRMANDAAGVHQEHRACIHAALLVEYPVSLAHPAVRPVVGEQREGDASQLLRPGLQAGDGIGADLQNFYIQLLELFEVLTEPLDLVLSSTGEGERKKRHHRFLALVTAQGKRFIQLRGK